MDVSKVREVIFVVVPTVCGVQKIKCKMKKLLIIVSVLSIFVFSCRTPEALIDRAIKKNPAIEFGKNDTIRLTKYVIDSIPYIVNDSIFYEKIIREISFDTIIKTNSIFIERKKTRQEIRKIYKLESENLRLSKKVKKLEFRITGKTDRKKIKSETKIERIKNRSKWWAWLIIGILTGMLLLFGLQRLIKNVL